MNIGIDARILERRVSGIGRYLLGFLYYLSKIDKENNYYLFCYEGLDDFEKMGYRVIRAQKSKFLPAKLYNFYWLNFILPKALKENKIDIFWNPNHYLPLKKMPVKTIITIHDMAHKIDKKYKSFIYRFFYLDFLLPYSAKRADLILTISKNSKKDIVNLLKIKKKSKIKVIYEAAEKKFKPRKNNIKLKEVQKKYKLPNDFILYVGRIEKRKNIETIIKIADFLIKKNVKTKIVLVGEGGYSGYDFLIKEIKKRKKIQHLNYIEDKDLPYIYNLAKVFLFPSFYEGFGLPVLEAMQSGIPVITSNTSSLPEVVGEGGIMHNPKDYKSFAKDIIKILNNEDFYEEMRKKAINQAKKFSWQKSTKELVDVFNRFKCI